MATKQQQSRQSRAKGRAGRRTAAAERASDHPQRKNEQTAVEPDRGGEEQGGRGRSTGALVLAGAVVGALAGTVKSLRGRRRHGEPDLTDSGGRDETPTRESSQRSSKQRKSDRPAKADTGNGGSPSSFRGAIVSVLEAAIEGLKNPPSQPAGRAGSQEGSDERSRGDEDDDEEAEREPHTELEDDEQPDDGNRPEARPGEADGGEESGERHRAAASGEGDEDEPPVEVSDREDGEADDNEAEDDDDAAASRNGHAHADTVELARRARAELGQLLGRRPETVSRLEHQDDGWHLGLEVVELERIPHSTDVLASYDVLVDDDGSLLHYARTRRYYRNRAEDE